MVCPQTSCKETNQSYMLVCGFIGWFLDWSADSNLETLYVNTQDLNKSLIICLCLGMRELNIYSEVTYGCILNYFLYLFFTYF